MICFQCKRTIDDDSNYCKFCGEKQAKTCPECGAAVAASARFCPRCDALVQADVGITWDRLTADAKTAFGKKD